MSVPSRFFLTCVLLTHLQVLEDGVHFLYSTTTYGWIKPLIAQHAERSPALMAICASIQIYVEQGPSLQHHQHFSRSLQTFQYELAHSNGVLFGPTMGAGLLVCTLSLLQGLPWTSHLICMVDLYKLHGGDLRGSLPPALDAYTHHCLEVLGIMDMPLFVLGRKTPCLSFWRRFRATQRLGGDNRNDGGIEPVSGLPRTLLDIFACSLEEDHDCEGGAETALWLWGGEEGEFMQLHLWDAWRYAGMLDYRRRKSIRAESGISFSDPTTSNRLTLPTTEQLLCRLLASLDALRLGLEMPETGHLLVANGMFYPYVNASLEYEILRSRPAWRLSLDRVHDKFLREDKTPNTQVLLQALHSSWQRGDTSFDPGDAMRSQGVEIALF